MCGINAQWWDLFCEEKFILINQCDMANETKNTIIWKIFYLNYEQGHIKVNDVDKILNFLFSCFFSTIMWSKCKMNCSTYIHQIYIMYEDFNYGDIPLRGCEHVFSLLFSMLVILLSW